MSVQDEREFLDPWAQAAADGGMLIVAPLRAAPRHREQLNIWRILVGFAVFAAWRFLC